MSNLDHILSHSDCLTEEQMKLYLENKLDKEQTYATESHITDCMFCSDAIEGLQILDADTNEENISDIRNHMEALLADIEEEKVASPLHAVKSKPQTLTATKGGKKISWAAIAGIFFLIFGGGLVVFSYINNNTNWFDNNPGQLSKNSKLENSSESESSNARSPEFGTITVDGSDLPASNNKKKLEKISSAEEKDFDITDKKQERFVKKSNEVVANNQTEKTRRENLLEKEASPVIASAPAKATPQPTAKSKVEEKKDVVAMQDNVMPNFGDISHQNTYSQPKYEGKLKDVQEIGSEDLNKSPSVAKGGKRKKVANENVSIGGGRDDETQYRIDQVQSKGLKKGTSSTEEFDAYVIANSAYHKGDYKKSIRYYKKALRQKDLKNRNEVLFQLALAYEKTNNKSKAEKIYSELEKSTTYKKSASEGLKRVRRASTK